MYKKAYKILKNNIVFIQPILIWQLICAAIFSFSLSRIQFFIPQIIMYISILLLFSAFLTGWLYINKLAVLSYNENDTDEEITEKTIQNFKKFFEGIGIGFIRTSIFLVISEIIYFAVFYGIYKFCMLHFGIPGFIKDVIQISENSSKEQIMQLVNNISDNEKIIFSNWVILMHIGCSILNFFTILYLTIMSFEKRNFAVSLYYSIKFIIKNIFESIGIMLFIFVLYLLIQILPVIFGINSIIAALFIIILTLYFNYYVLLVFCFYYDKTKNNSDNRSECFRKDEISDKSGEEN